MENVLARGAAPELQPRRALCRHQDQTASENTAHAAEPLQLHWRRVQDDPSQHGHPEVPHEDSGAPTADMVAGDSHYEPKPATAVGIKSNMVQGAASRGVPVSDPRLSLLLMCSDTSSTIDHTETTIAQDRRCPPAGPREGVWCVGPGPLDD